LPQPQAKSKKSVSENRVDFFLQFLKHPRQIGSVIPSSGFLTRRVLEAAELGSARVVVELGPGTGGTTRAMLNAMAPNATLLSVDINPRFVEMVSRIQDPRLVPHLGSAAELRDILAHHELSAPDVVISGIPFSTMPPNLGTSIIEEIRAALAPGGRFVAYQASSRVAALCRPIMGPGEDVLELRNIPPMRVYTWMKNGH
jgi:phosphatidylethanolamine/phosphatidyl-N-methylethanolamine N-methyltransferase